MMRYAVCIVSMLLLGGMALPLSGSTKPAITGSSLVRAAEQITPSIVLVRTVTLHAYPQPHEDVGNGTGVVMTKDGEILTNAHVVDGASVVEVLFPPFQFIEAKVVGLNRETEIALLKIVVPTGRSLMPAVWGDSRKLHVGETVMKGGFPGAIHSQYPSFAHGIVTNLRTFVGDFSTPLIATDARISGGDSGGPLVNARGEVIGIDVAFAMDEANMTNVAGLAIPSHIAQRTWHRLAHGNMRTGWLGFIPRYCVNLRQMHGDRMLAKDIAGYFAEQGMAFPTEKQGFLIIAFTRKEQAGDGEKLRIGDIIIRVNGRVPQDAHELVQWVTETEPGTDIALDIVREGTATLMRLKVGELDWKKKVKPPNGHGSTEDPKSPMVPQ